MYIGIYCHGVAGKIPISLVFSVIFASASVHGTAFVCLFLALRWVMMGSCMVG
jgi:hypothetical protein